MDKVEEIKRMLDELSRSRLSELPPEAEFEALRNSRPRRRTWHVYVFKA